ncbi:MAG TPA: pseudouridine synthase [Terriglobales bacterium]|nr:pseudouridine synthase [Terriglobales bacterium]
MQERLQKIIAAAGLASRRHAEELIKSGMVSVNGQTVTELGTKADPAVDHIKVGNKLLKHVDKQVYILLHKPKGYVTTSSDPEGRPTVMDLVRNVPVRVYPVGRLDYASEGLLLLTNDGDLTQKLTHASSHVSKTYLVKVAGIPTEESLNQLRKGVLLQGVKPKAGNRRRPEKVRTAPAKIEAFREGNNPWYEITIIEGRNRQIRRMFEEVGHHVEKIKRVRYGPLELDVEPGRYRSLTEAEVARLKQSVRPKRTAS